jgi:hypothetical protein
MSGTDAEPVQQRTVLSKTEVLEIFAAGIPREGTFTMKIRSRGQILQLSRKYQVTPKTIRDIWNRRTWRSVTSSLVSLTQYKLSSTSVSNHPCDKTDLIKKLNGLRFCFNAERMRT